MQDAVQYGAVEASSPPTPPKRFGRKTVVALAALGLAGVAALSLGPQKKTATGLVVSPGRPLCLKPGQAWNGWTGTSTQVLHVSQLQPQFADWRGSGKVPAIMRGQRHQLTFRERMLPVRPGLDRRNPQQRRHPALKSGPPCQDRLLCPIDSPPRCPDCVHNTYVSFLRARRIARGGPG